MKTYIGKKLYTKIALLSTGAIMFIYSIVCFAGSLVVDDAYVTKYGKEVKGGNFQGTTTQSAILVTTTTPITISNTTVSGPGNLIQLNKGTHVTIVNTTGTGTNPNVSGTQKGAFVNANNIASIDMHNCTITGTRFGILVVGYTGNASAGDTISITKNVFNNIDGRKSDGNGGYIIQADWRAHAIQLNGIHGAPHVEIAWNQVITVPFQGDISDNINIYDSGGTQNDPLLVHDNFIKGALPGDPGVDVYHGGGIICDGTANATSTSTTQFVNIYNNQVTMTANYGVGIAVGHDNTIYNNRVVSAGILSTGGVAYASTFATGGYNYNAHSQTSSVFFNNHVKNNVLGLLRPSSSGSSTLMRADWYLPGQSSTENNISFTPVSNKSPILADEATELANWQQKLLDNSITIGAETTSTGTIRFTASSTSDTRCATASDKLFLDGSTSGVAFTVVNGISQSVNIGVHTLALNSTTTAIPAGGGLTGTCSSTLNTTSVTVTDSQTTPVNATYTYQQAVSTGTIHVSVATGSDSKCANASDTLYLDGGTQGTPFTVSNGISETVSTGQHQLRLASANSIPAGSGQTGTCTGTLSASSVLVSADQASNVTTLYQYQPATGATCTLLSPQVKDTPTWDVKVDHFLIGVQLTGFPVDSSGNISINGTMIMKNVIRQLWADQSFTYTLTGSSGTFSGNIYADTGSGAFNLEGYLTDATPAVLSVGDNPVQSVVINGITCN